MPLKIRYLNGPYAGRDIDIEDHVAEVRFGRGLDADIPFPEEMTIVSRQHFGLRKEYGGYKFIINREKPVFLNGRPVLDDQDLPKTAEIQLSGAEGPRLRIERLDGYGSNQAKTEILTAAPDVAVTLHRQQAQSRRTALTLAVVALALIVAAGGGYWLWQGTQQQVAATGQTAAEAKAAATQAQSDVAALKQELPSIKDQVDALGRAVDFTALIEEVKGSVYQVAVERPSGTLVAMGTAWVVQLPDGTKALGTNAHIADIFEDVKAPEWGGARLIAIEPRAPDYTRVAITGVKKHPAYDQWNEFSNAYYQKAQAGAVRDVSLPIGYDVAILYVDRPDLLGKPLKLASQETLEAMKAGERLLQIGYPSEHVLGTDIAKPEPNSNSGAITAMTSFFLSVGEAKDRQFIQHTASGAGGSSGSAMFNDKGEVVGLHNSGNYIFIQTGPGENDYERVPSGGNINYAQRADLLAELIEGRAEERTEKVYKPMWAEAERQFSKPAEAIVKDQIAALAEYAGGADKVAEWKVFEGTMENPDPLLDGMKSVVFDIDPPPGYLYLFLASAEDQRNVGTALFLPDGTFFGVGTRGAFLSSYFVQYDVAMPAKVAVFDDFYDKDGTVDTRPRGKIKLTIYSAPIPGYVAPAPGG